MFEHADRHDHRSRGRARLRPRRRACPDTHAVTGRPSVVRLDARRRPLRRHHLAHRPGRYRLYRRRRRAPRGARRADPQCGRGLPRTGRRIVGRRMADHHGRQCHWGGCPYAGVLPALRSAAGHVVFINSGSGINASPGLASYSSSKFALRGSPTRCATTSRQLRVTSVHPGRIATVMQEDLIAYEGRDYDPERVPQRARLSRRSPPTPSTRRRDAHIHEVIVRPR